jgi:4-amino-4-deoxy-L-arabinose transferase-like glycosyltransferase
VFFLQYEALFKFERMIMIKRIANLKIGIRFTHFDLIMIAITSVFMLISIFYKLGADPIFIWDEAIYANNALDMALSTDPIVLRMDGEVNLYNVKPPLVIWLQAICVSILGPSELAIRLPSAIFSIGTCFVLFIFLLKLTNSIGVGCLSILTLVTTHGFIRHHVARTGDLDAVLVFWITLYTCTAVHYLIKLPREPKAHFTLITIGVVAAFWSKSVAGLIPLPGLLIAALALNRLQITLKIKYLYKCIAFGSLACVGFYLIRELMSPGYLNVVARSDYLRYFKNIMPWHEQPFYFYIRNMITRGFLVPHLYLLPLPLLFALRGKKSKSLSLALLLYCITYLIIISVPAVKLEWYDAPIYPFVSALLGIGLLNIYEFARQKFKNGKGIAVLLIALYSVYIGYAFCITFRRINDNNGMPVDPLEREGYFMKQLKSTKPDYRTYSVLMPVRASPHLSQVSFYARAFNISDNYNVTILEKFDGIKISNVYLYCQAKVEKELAEHYTFTRIDSSENGCSFVRITSRKSD